ncbi:MAG: serine hydroxymethyltransferase [Patescibacteria group bacterium]|mgnify:CR=1 FL=1
MKDKEVKKLIEREERRQNEVVNLIASENVVSDDVREALGSVFTNKYAEGYSKLRYYAGNEVVDDLETLTKERALALFKLSPKEWAVNVQAYSGTPANLAVLWALVPLGEKVMGMALPQGGHLSHGHIASATGKLWKQVPYGLDKKTERLDYKRLAETARREKPKLVIAGFTAYSRAIEWKKFREIADAGNAILLADLSHTAGIVAGGALASPFPHADVVMTTTHKTLRGPRAALIFSRERYAKAIDRAVFPGLQGGPHANTIAGVAVALAEASKPAFARYARQVVRNAQALAGELEKRGWHVISRGTDTHLFLLDTAAHGITGKAASDALEAVGIIVNKNTLPFDTRSPQDPSGIRLGTPAVTSRGMKERDMKQIAHRIDGALRRAIDALKKKK